jgi:hypothetical protein
LNVSIENDWHAKGRIFASKSYSSKKQLSVILVVIIMPRNRGGGGGTFRVTDNTAITIGADVQVQAEHVTALNTTKKKESSDEKRKGHRRCLKKIVLWWMAEYPEYFEVGTRVLSVEEKADPMKFYHTCDRDIVYEGLRVDMMLSYMAATKKKGDVTNGDEIYCYDHMRKIHDAVLFCARTVKQVLSSSYYSEMDSFLASFKKERADARSHGNVDEKKADPISFSLF